MKPFLLRFKGIIFASAQIQKMTVKVSEKKSHRVYVCGPFDKIRAEEPREIFMDERKHVNLVANRLGKALFLSFIFTEFFGF